jgi:hypothetical protein
MKLPDFSADYSLVQDDARNSAFRGRSQVLDTVADVVRPQIFSACYVECVHAGYWEPLCRYGCKIRDGWY